MGAIFKLHFIASGSTGNACTLSDGKTKVLIDCGISIDTLRKFTSLTHIDAILLTHEHGDHSSRVVQLANNLQIPLLTGAKTHEKVSKDLSEYLKVTIRAGKQYRIRSLIFTPFKVYHDAAEPLGFLFGNKLKETFAFISDTGTLNGINVDANFYAIECNYDEFYLRQRLNTEDITDLQYYRMIAYDGHMSVQDVTYFLHSRDYQRAFLHHRGSIPPNYKPKSPDIVMVDRGLCNESYYLGYIPPKPGF